MTDMKPRKLRPEARAEQRRLACRMYESDLTMTHEKIAALLDVHPGTVQRWISEWCKYGEESFVPKLRHGGAEAQRKLTPEQEEWVAGMVREHEPRTLGIAETGFWTIARVRELIARDLGIEVSSSATHRMMQRRGLRPRVPLRRAYARDEAEVERFEYEEWPEVVAMKAAGATLVFLDGASVREDSPAPRTWAPKGTRPVVKVKGSRAGVQVISAVSFDGDLWFRTFHGTLNAVRFCDLLAELMAELPGPLIVVLDRHPAHRARLTREFVEAQNGRLRLIELPRYAPDLNPAEHVWSYLKGHALRRYPVRPHENVRNVVNAEMQAIQSQPDLIRSFFMHPSVRYTLGLRAA